MPKMHLIVGKSYTTRSGTRVRIISFDSYTLSKRRYLASNGQKYTVQGKAGFFKFIDSDNDIIAQD